MPNSALNETFLSFSPLFSCDFYLSFFQQISNNNNKFVSSFELKKKKKKRENGKDQSRARGIALVRSARIETREGKGKRHTEVFVKRCRGLSITPFARIPAKSHPSPSRLRASLYESKDSFSFAACSRLVVSSMPPPFHLHRITRPSIHSSHRNPPFSLAYRELTTCNFNPFLFYSFTPCPLHFPPTCWSAFHRDIWQRYAHSANARNGYLLELKYFPFVWKRTRKIDRMKNNF